MRGGATLQEQVFRVDGGRFHGENAHSVVQGNVASGWSLPKLVITDPSRPNVFNASVGD